MTARRLRKRIMAMVLAVGMTLSMAGCGANDSGTDDRKDASAIKEANTAVAGETDATAATEETASTKKTTYPLTITTYNTDGTEMETTYEKAPEKVLAVYQGSVETMLALGLEDRLVATAGLDNEVPDSMKAAFSETNYLDEFTPSLETVTMLEPDMIFSWGSIFTEEKLGEAKGWVEKGVNTYMNTNTHPKQGEVSYDKTLENEYNDILNIGKIFDVQDKAEAIVEDMKTAIAQVKEKTASVTEKPSVLVLEPGKDAFTNYNATSLGGDMVTQLGGELVNPEVSSMGKEDLVNANPDVIFVVYMPYAGDDPEQVKQDKLNTILEDDAFASLDAVKNGRVVPIMLSEMYASATRTKDGIVSFAKGLYPDIELGLE